MSANNNAARRGVQPKAAHKCAAWYWLCIALVGMTGLVGVGMALAGIGDLEFIHVVAAIVLVALAIIGGIMAARSFAEVRGETLRICTGVSPRDIDLRSVRRMENTRYGVILMLASGEDVAIPVYFRRFNQLRSEIISSCRDAVQQGAVRNI